MKAKARRRVSLREMRRVKCLAFCIAILAYICFNLKTWTPEYGSKWGKQQNYFSSLGKQQNDGKSLGLVDCSRVEEISPVQIRQMTSIVEPSYPVSLAWWDRRLKATKEEYQKVNANASVKYIQKLLNEASPNSLFIDIGANVGFMTMCAISQKRQVIAVEPIGYNIAKLCEGLRAQQPDVLHLFMKLYHAAAGPYFVPSVNITRPSDKVGFFDQSSLSREAVYKGDIVTEHIPLVAVDSLVTSSQNVAVVKIDVQGHEYGVVKGMKELWSRPKGSAPHVFYEDLPSHTQAAGHQPGAVKQFLENDFGYTCKNAGTGDIIYSK
jgi:FkbM family methyltransferase